MTDVQLPAGYVLQLPPSWIEIELSPEKRNRELEALMVDVEDEAMRHELEAFFRVRLAQAWDRGTVMAAFFSSIEPVEIDGDDGEPAEPVLLAAGVTVALVDTDGAVVTADFIASSLADDDEDVPEDRRIEEVDLPGASGLKVTGTVVFQDTDWPEPARFYQAQYFFPVPDGSGVGVLTFSTPTISLAEAFDDLFLAVAETFSWSWE